MLVESEEGVITYYDVYEGNPGDETLLIGAVLRHWDAVGNIPKEVAADRGFYSSDNERVLRELGVKRVSIPKRGRKARKGSNMNREHGLGGFNDLGQEEKRV